MKSLFYQCMLIIGLVVFSLSLAQAKEKHGKEAAHHHDEKPAHDDHHQQDEEEVTGGVGPGNAVTAADEHDGIKLSSKAQKTIGLKVGVYSGGDVIKSALVYHQDHISVYRFKDAWFKLIPVAELKIGDHIVVSGTALLRVSELDAFSTETGHSH